MFEHLFADPKVLLLGALTGLTFGFILQKGGITRFRVIVGQFLLKDFTVLKIMLTAILVGGIGIYGMRALGLEVSLHIKNAAILGNVLGGLIFGAGMALLGYCPGTGVAALGDGSRHALFGVFGMLTGAAIYAEVYPWMKSSVLGIGDLGKATLPTLTELSPWWYLALLTLAAVAIFMMLERWEQKQKGLPVPGSETLS